MEPEILAAFDIEGATLFYKAKPEEKDVRFPDIDIRYKYGAIARGVFEGSQDGIAIIASKQGKTYRLALSVIFQGKPYGMNNLGELVQALEDRRKAADENNG